jgi:hypothetical protein
VQNDEAATLRGPIQILHSTFCILHLRWSARQDLHLRSLGSKPSMLLLHHALDILTPGGRQDRRTRDTKPWERSRGKIRPGKCW